MDRRTFSQMMALSLVAHGPKGMCGADETLPNPGPPTGRSPNPIQPASVSDFRRRAQVKLPPATFDYIETGSLDQVTLRENVAAFQRLKLLPPILSGVEKVDLSTSVLKQPVSLPILLAPVAAQRLYHPQGALAAARAAHAEGTLFGVSSSATNSIEEIAKASPGPKWFQLYVPKDRAVARKMVERAVQADCKAIIVTVDLGESKDADRRNRFALPRDMLIKHMRDAGLNGAFESMSYEELIVVNSSSWDLSFSWEIFDWLRSVTKLPLLIKGVLRPDDAKKAVSLGLDGIIVSNHGGRRLDGMPASIDMLPGVVEAVAGRAEIFLDSGVRRGTDVLKALALGAKAVLIGRPYVWGLAADGENGVRKIIELLREELRNSLHACGCPNVQSIPRSLVIK